jgi:SAM-dependent methyltransferase
MSDPKDVVRDGYDRLGARYHEWTLTVDPVHRDTYQVAVARLDPGSRVIELGCGPGTTASPIADVHRYIGVDLSAAQLALARRNVRSASFVRADMTTVAFRPQSVDAVIAFYSLIHVPRAEQEHVLRSIATWLRPGGVAAFNMTARDDPGGVYAWVDDVPMYWSGFDWETNLGLVRHAGLTIVRHEVLTNFEDDQEVRFLWVLARR